MSNTLAQLYNSQGFFDLLKICYKEPIDTSTGQPFPWFADIPTNINSGIDRISWCISSLEPNANVQDTDWKNLFGLIIQCNALSDFLFYEYTTDELIIYGNGKPRYNFLHLWTFIPVKI